MTSMAVAKPALFYLIRAMGGFALARRLTRKRLRILCYHGFSIGDEFAILPFMFMRKETFERRMQILQRRAIPVVALDAALKRLRTDSIENAETVITLDDGWASNLTIALPILERYGYPACVYVTTEHLSAGVEAFNVALYYMIRKSSLTSVTLTDIHPAVDGMYDLHDAEAAVSRLIRATESAFSLKERQQLLHQLALALGVSVDEVFKDGRFSFLSANQIQMLAERGVDIELHTHTHRLPAKSFEDASAEIRRNRSALKDLLGREARHFCYPSGVHKSVHPEWLQRLDVESATTCDPGLNTARTPPMLLKRFLDSDEMSDILFEAEVCGVRDLIRDARLRVRQIFES
jgi:peptidoglycan/xylan/chitin deacetylase (PgdA/CDA1 family)